jgi:Tol biopolymer transport system component
VSAVDLFTLDAFTGERVGMGTLQRGAAVAGQHIEWSADRRAAFVYADTDSVSARIDVVDRSIAALVGVPPTGSSDSVSPSGDKIARLTDDNDLAILDLNGDPMTTIALPDGIQPLLRVRWSPDSSMVAVSSCLPCGDKGEGVPWHVFLAPIDGGPVRQVGDLAVEYIAIDDWSSDGRHLLLSDASCPDATCTGGLLVMDAATGVAARLTSTGETSAVFSPDGSQVAYIDGLFGTRISVKPTDDAPGGGRAVATVPDGAPIGFDDPTWSPNGDWILYRQEPVVDGQQTGIGDLWMVPSAGGEPRLVIKNAIADW